MYPVDIEDKPGQQMVALAHKGSYLEIGKRFEQLGSIFAARALWPQARGMVGLFYDDPNAVDEAELRSQAGIVVGADFVAPDDLDLVDVPSGRMAVMHYKGPYSGLKAAYDYLYGVWLPKTAEEPRDGPAMEIYLNNPQEVAPDELLTDVCVPIRDAGA